MLRNTKTHTHPQQVYVMKKGMKKILKFDVEKIAALSKLSFEEKECELMEKEMTAFVDFVGDIPDIQDDSPLIDIDDVMELRKDVVQNTINRDDLFKPAPQVKAGCIVVPLITNK